MTSNVSEAASPTSSANKSSCTYEDTLHQLGDFGRYQRRIIFLLCLPAISCGMHKLSGVFLQISPNHRCLLPNESLDATYELNELNMSLPWDSNTDSWSSCLRLNVVMSPGNDSSFSNTSVPCSDWIYDKMEIKSSVTTEWNLVCDQNWLRPLADSSVMLGVLLGAIIFGELSDRYGRKKIYLYALMLQVLCGFITAVAPNYVTFVILRLLTGASTSGVFLVAYVIALEIVGQKKRMLTGVVSLMFFTVGYILLAGFAYFIRDWRYLQAALTAPGIFFIVYIWYIPESARWLITKHRLSEGKEILRKMAKENRTTTVSESVLTNLTYSDETPTQKVSLLKLVKYPNMRKRALIIFFNWFVNDVTYYGLSLNTSEMEGDVYLNFFISGLVEFPAYILILLTLNKWGRKPVVCGCMLLSGTSLIFTLIVPSGMVWVHNILYMLGKLAITASYGVMYIFTTEQFPTVIRNAALGASSMCGRIGGITAPFINLLGSLWDPLPQLLFGVVSVVGGFLAILLPETLNRALPDTIEESEKFSVKKMKSEN